MAGNTRLQVCKGSACFRGSQAETTACSPCASTTWHGIRNTGRGQRAGSGREGSLFRRGPWLTRPQAPAPSCFWYLAAITDFMNKPPDGALSRARAGPPTPTPASPGCTAYSPKHLQRAGCRCNPTGLARGGRERRAFDPETRSSWSSREGEPTGHPRSKADGASAGGDLGAWGTPGSGPEHRQGVDGP